LDFEEFVRQHLRQLLRFGTVLCGEPGLAEDVVQEVLLRAHRRWDTLRGLDKPDAYVRKMMVNEHISWRRKWSRQVPTAEVLPPGEVPDPAVGYAARCAVVTELALRYYCGLSDPNIAEMMGCRESTVRVHMSRGLAALRVHHDGAPTLILED
jgi:DNA-directed RNA polymerase specialized sigma24 family protein